MKPKSLASSAFEGMSCTPHTISLFTTIPLSFTQVAKMPTNPPNLKTWLVRVFVRYLVGRLPKSVDTGSGVPPTPKALAYYEKLKPSCVDSGVSYEDRVARRKEEIQSLQEALKILNGDDIA